MTLTAQNKSKTKRMKAAKIIPVAVAVLCHANAFSMSIASPSRVSSALQRSASATSPLFRRRPFSTATVSLAATTAASTASPSPDDTGTELETTVQSRAQEKIKERRAQLRKDGGIFVLDTPFGALNPFGLYYGLVSIALGLVWFAELFACQVLYTITRNNFDRLRRLPIFFSHVWGTLLMRFTRCYPEIENREVLMDFYKKKKAAMFVSNHNSWMDIPFVGAAIGWRNYKMVSKAELAKVPILGRGIKVGGHVLLDRSDRRSQLKTLKKGIQYLNDGVHLVTFPEGTRSRSGRLMKFKNGAFKMAHKSGAPVVPLSVVASGKVMPARWMFPFRPARGVAKVVVHDPVESEGKTEAELVQEVREAIIAGLPEEQRPA